MSPARVTLRRTAARIGRQTGTAFAFWVFLAASAVMFAFGLSRAEGGDMPLAAIWAAAVSPVLPVFAALLAMDVWSGERQSGGIDMLLAVSVRERDLVLGKFLGCLFVLMSSIVICLAVSLAVLWRFAPAALFGSSPVDFLLAFCALFVQGILWTAVSVAASAVFRRAATAAVVSVLLTVAVPRGVWAALMAWSDSGRTAFGEMPLDAHAVDFASGLVSTGVVAFYLVATFFFLFVASKAVLSYRLSGGGARMARLGAGFSVLLAAVFSVLAVVLAARLDVSLDMPAVGSPASFSPRTRSVLSEAGGGLTATCFMTRSDPRFRSAARFLRQLRREAESAGGGPVTVRFVDPRWDLGPAERLVRRGVETESIVFELGRRLAVLPLRDGLGERACASTIRSLATPPSRRVVYWTSGHGESLFDAYGTFGMSDIARDLAREGYRNDTLDLEAKPSVPADSALVVVSGAKQDFSRAELGRLEAYLRNGGRLLLLLGAPLEGISSTLTAWGIRPSPAPVASGPTLSGTDVAATDFSGHAISAPLRGERLVLERPFAFEPSSAAKGGTGVDRIVYSPVASAAGAVVAVAVERGAGAGVDLAVRPTRIVAVGDASFAMNGPLADRANANRDFFLNCVAYLSGTDASGSIGTGSGVFTSRMDRNLRRSHLLFSAGIVPAVALLLMLFAAWLRGRRA